MGTYYIPRDTKGEGRILYVFSKKGLLFTVGCGAIGYVLKFTFSLFGSLIPAMVKPMNVVGWVIFLLFAVVGFVIGSFKVPNIDKFEFTKKAAGIEISTVIWEYVKFHFKKDKLYVYDTKDLIIEQLEKEEAEKEFEKEKENKQ